MGISKSFIAKLMMRLETIAVMAAGAFARFQLKPTATVGTSAAANVAQPNAPISATSIRRKRGAIASLIR